MLFAADLPTGPGGVALLIGGAIGLLLLGALLFFMARFFSLWLQATLSRARSKYMAVR